MKKFYLILIALFNFVAVANCQVINNAEYFFDTDPGLGKGTAITLSPNDTISLKNVAINSTGLLNGYHYLYVRVKDSNGVWSHYRRQRFFVFNNSPILPVNDSAVLAQAEYWIDSLPVPGTGKLIPLPAKDTLFYNDAIPGLRLDSGIHKVSVRVKDSKGNWSFPKTDSIRTEYYDIDISVVNKPFIRRGEWEKFEVTLKNRGNKSLYDIFLVLLSSKIDSIKILPQSDYIQNTDVNGVDGFTNFNNQKYAPIWLYNLPAQSIYKFDIYLKYSGIIFRHDEVTQEFSLYAKEDKYSTRFKNIGDTSDFKNSRLFSMIYNTIYFEQKKVSAFNIADSLVVQKLDSSFKLTPNLFQKPSLINKLIKPVINNGFNLNTSDSSTNLYSTYSFAFLRQSYFEQDGTKENLLGGRINEPSNEKCNTPCLLTCNTSFQPPLMPIEDFVITKYPCKKRCACECISGAQQNVPDVHQGLDISIKNNPSPEISKKWDDGYEVKCVYRGVVVKVNWEYPNESDKGAYEVVVKSNCPDGSMNRIFVVAYEHLKPEKLVEVGQSVEAGQVIGKVGNPTNGFSTGPHLHLEIYYEENCNANNLISNLGYDWYFDAEKDDTCPSPINGPCIKEIPKSCILPDGTLLNFGGCPPNTIDVDCTSPPPVNPIDPNDKIGNEGYALQRYIKSTEQLHYGIFFQNIDTATASAQVVTIIDTLDLSKVDKHSFYFESVTAGNMLVVLPDSVKLQNIDSIYRAEKINGTYVHIKATFDTTTGIIKFTLSSLDTATLQPVTGALEGFLPPDTTKFDGNGLVSYKVTALSNIPGGTVITNTSHIVFDNNPPIATGTWFNTIDGAKPSSEVNVLPAITHDSSFTVSWSGTDDGAGISAYDIYYKTSGDTAYTKWLDFTSLTSAVFSGSVDSTYQFYSVAYDSVLNVEDAPSTADAFTKISFAKPIIVSSFAANCALDKVSIQWVAAAQPNINYFTIEKSADSISWISTGNIIQPYSDTTQTRYNFSDTYNGSDYYRLQVTSKDSMTSYSHAIKINCGSIVNTIKVYPIPAKNLLNILIESNQSSQLDMILTDMSGRIIRRIKNDVQKGTNYFTLNTEALPSGQYILKTKSILNLKSRKFTIIR